MKSLKQFYTELCVYISRYEGDAEDLGLVFSAEDETFGKRVSIPLLAGGDRVAVTNDNKLQYIQLMADWQLNGRLGGAASQFSNGIRKVRGCS